MRQSKLQFVGRESKTKKLSKATKMKQQLPDQVEHRDKRRRLESAGNGLEEANERRKNVDEDLNAMNLMRGNEKGAPSSSGVARKRTRMISDAVHGRFFIHGALVDIMETRQFQRLRKLKQMGVSEKVWPSANHSRFEHCLGVCYLAGKWVKSLMDNQPELGITSQDLLCVQIAGMCHDLGHGPFSHLFDGMLLPAMGIDNWTHEQGSLMMLNALMEENQIDLSQYSEDIDHEEAMQFIRELIFGVDNETRMRRDEGVEEKWPRKRFLYDIVHNGESGLDVDKLDYFQRDVLFTGVEGPGVCTFEELVTQSRVQMCDDGLERICFPERLYKVALRAFRTRFDLHDEVYTHKDVKAFELTLVDIIQPLFAEFKIRGKTLKEAINDPKVYLEVNDSIVDLIGEYLHHHGINSETHKHCKEMLDILNSSRLDLMYQCCGWMPLPSRFYDSINGKINTKPSRIAELICDHWARKHRPRRNNIPNHAQGDGLQDFFEEEVFGGSEDIQDESEDDCEDPDLSPEHLKVEFMGLHYGKKAENPVDSMYFFRDDQEDTLKASRILDGARKAKYKNSIPSAFIDRRIRVFCRDLNVYPVAKKAFLSWQQSNFDEDHQVLSQI